MSKLDYVDQRDEHADMRDNWQSEQARRESAERKWMLDALAECAAAWSSEPGAAQDVAAQMAVEFQRRMAVAGAVLTLIRSRT